MKYKRYRACLLSAFVAAAAAGSILINCARADIVSAAQTVPSGKEFETSSGIVSMGSGTAAIKVNGNANQTLIGKRFSVYQLFLAENSRDGESVNYTFDPVCEDAVCNTVSRALSKSGKAVSPEEVTEYMAIDYIQSLNNNPVEGAQAEQEQEGYYREFRYFVEALRDEIVSLGISSDTVVVTSVLPDNSVRLTGLDYGYYVLDEVSYVDGTNSAASLCMVDTANPAAEMNVKSDYPSVIKKIQEDDENGNISDSGNWNDIGDFEIGQTVPYKFSSYIPNINGYDAYYYAWHDRMDQALSLEEDSIKIQIEGKSGSQEKRYILEPGEYRLISIEDSSEETFCVEIEDVKEIVDREFNNIDDRGHNIYGQTVTFTYDAVLNEHAANDTGRPGFENDVCLEFSNDADGDGGGSTGYTPWDTVVCFTYQLEVVKLNDYGKALKGAKFRLYSDKNCEQEVYVKRINAGYAVINRDSVGGNDHTGGTMPGEAVEMTSGEDGVYTIYGLDSGTYYLKEIEAPDGYRKLKDPIILKIEAVYTGERDTYMKGQGESDQILRELKVTAYIEDFYNGVTQKEDTVLEADEQSVKANLTVINRVGKKLPVTGTYGIVLMFAAGISLMIFASVQTRRKREKDR